MGLTTDQVSMLREFDPIIFHFRGGTVRRLAIDTVLRLSLLNPSLPGITLTPCRWQCPAHSVGVAHAQRDISW